MNARFPAPVTLCTVFPAHEIIHCVWKALADVAADRVSAAWAKTAYPVTAGYDEREEFFVVYHWGGGTSELSGTVSGKKLELEATIEIGEFQIEAKFSATIDGSTMEGTSTYKTPFSEEEMKVPFTAERTPEKYRFTADSEASCDATRHDGEVH